MNKLFTKIATLSVGLAMAIGVGVAVGSNSKDSPVSAANSTYNKVSLDDIADGDKVLIVSYYNSSTWYYLPSTTSTSSAPVATSVTVSNNTITADLDSLMFTMGGTGSSRTFYNGSKYLYVSGNNNNNLRVGSSTAATWTVTATTNGYKMTHNSRWCGVYNGADWRSYTTSSATNYKGSGEYINFYKKASKSLSSIALSGTYPTAFEQGDTFSHDGMTVTATYSDSTTANVTSSATFSGYNMSNTGSQTVTVSYTEGGTTKTATYTISVSAHTHTFSSDWTSNDTHHWHAATCGHDVKDSYTEHGFGEWVIDTAASCTTAGSKHHVCSVCSKRVDEAIPATGHNYVNHVCTVCGAIEPNEVTVSMTTFEAISGFVEGDNNISYLAEQGEAATAPVVNGGEIRIYQNGGLLTITGNNGSKIKSITIGSSMATSVSIEVDGDASGSESIAANDTITVSDLNADEVVFTCTGTDKYSRLYLNNLSVTYEGTPETKYTITYDANTTDEVTGSMSPTVGTNPAVAACAFGREGYSFSRWNTQADGEGDDYAVGTTVTEDITLYVIWQEYIEPIGANVTMTGVTSATPATVNGYDAIKCGTGSAAGEMTLTLVNANITKIKVYIAAWKGEAKTVDVSINNSATISESSLSLTADNGVSNTSPFTLEGEETDYKFEFTISSNAPAGTVITLTAGQAKNNRFVVWGATDLFADSFVTEFNSSLTCNVSGTSAPSFAQDKDWTTLESFFNGLDDEEKGILRSAEYTKSGSGSSTVITPTGGTSQTVAEAMARYDYIEGKYNPDGKTVEWKNFIGRTITPIGGNSGALIPSLMEETGNITAIIAIVSVVSVAAIGGYFFLRKKKED